ncbi:TOR signaling pathway regulator TapA [Trichuris trichiura]|uniref:TOR signaling pathway regulator TapA n=1 Tax=Trichuris trichiura TaxID=36087 RepID=A0A077ZLS9_TRITR|nr:TOR signaling pathway regulator TapA [Trichuris trichiura]
MASEPAKLEAPLYDQFLELGQRSEQLLDRRGSLNDKSEIANVAKDCMDVAKKLEDVITNIDKLGLYSENEQLDDIATKDLRLMKASAYLGLLLVNGSDSNRLDSLEKAIVRSR